MSDLATTPGWVAIAIALVGLVPGVLAYAAQVRRDRLEASTAEASAAAELTGAATAFVDRLTKRINDLEEDLLTTRKELADAEARMAAITSSLADAEKRITSLEAENARLRCLVKET